MASKKQRTPAQKAFVRVYVITLTGQGDTDVKLVDKETYDWVVAPKDVPVPRAVQARIDKEFEESTKVHLTNTYENDRAIYAQAVYGRFWSWQDALKVIGKKGYKVVQTYEGYIY